MPKVGLRARLLRTCTLAAGKSHDFVTTQVSAETRAAFSKELLMKAQRKMEKTNKRAEFKDRLEKAAQEAVSMLHCSVLSKGHG
jgi:23S rRNA maturation mini-RNase III